MVAVVGGEMSERRQGLLATLAIGVVGLVYVLTAARTVQGGDSGELATVGATGDVAHPPGYPLFVLWLRALGWLPAASIAHRASLATVLTGVAALMLVHRACRAWGASMTMATLATSIFAVSPIAWRLSTEPEVFMLNVALAMVIVTLAAPVDRPFRFVRSEEQRVLLLALAAGLGLSNHHSIVLLAPLGVTAAIAAIRRSAHPPRAALGALFALVVGLSPYLYLVYAARHPTSSCTWGDTSTFKGLLHHFLRADYGTFNLAASARRPSPALNLSAFASGVVVQSGGFAILALAPPLVAIRRRRRPSLESVMLAVSFLAAGPLLIARFNTYPIGLAERIVERFYLFPLALLTVFAAVGASQVIEGRSRLVAVVAPLAIFLGRGGFTWGNRLEEARYRGATEAYVRDVFRITPRRSILLVAGDDAVGGFFYAKCALRLRDDVDVVTPMLLLTDWYWPRLTAQLSLPKPITHAWRSSPESEPVLNAPLVIDDLVATNRPVVLNQWFATTLPTRFSSYPHGPLIRIVAPSEVPDPDHLLLETEELYAVLEVPAMLRPPPARDTWAGARAPDYARPWSALAEAFERNGARERAAYCRDRARSLTPEPTSGLGVTQK